jgi:hypothetical protein
MHVNHPARLAERQLKREKLAEIVSRLGRDASPEAIREQAYALGVGKVHPRMLTAIRNEVFPDRKKRGGGRPPGTTETSGGKGRECPHCHKNEAFFFGTYNGKTRQGVESKRRSFKCRECLKSFSLDANDSLTVLHARRVHAARLTAKTCTKCKTEKPIEEFRLKPNDSILRTSHCRQCQNEARARYSRTNTEEMYGITAEQYQQMLRQQNGKCAICNGRANQKRMKHTELCIDHCHETGVVRGLLCSRCNLGIGNFGDRLDLIKAAVEYLEHRTK